VRQARINFTFVSVPVTDRDDVQFSHISKNEGLGYQAARSPDDRYRMSPLNDLWSHATGGYYHDGRFATLGAVVDHCNTCLEVGLSAQQQSDLVEFLKSL
jgi:hypothetical protein